MKISPRRWTLSGLLLVVGLAGCASAEPLRGLDADALFQRGVEKAAGKHWTDAINAFERFILSYPNDPRNQEAHYRLAQAYFGKKEYITSASEFTRLATDYPNGPYADDARFGVCQSYAELSPRSELDQQYTHAAIDACQSLITYYGTSEFVPRARQIVVQMTEKLADKSLENAEFYFKRRAWNSAVIYFQATINTYPTTAAAPKALLGLIQSYDNLGYKDEAATARQRLLHDYPESEAARKIRPDTLVHQP